MSNDPNEMKKMRLRSPAYPAVSLPVAVEFARKLWESLRKQEGHIDYALKVMGYNSKNGASLRTIGALNHYGLTDETGAKDDRKIKLSEQAQDILLRPEGDPARQRALTDAALRPVINQALWERYGKHVPEASAIRPFLVRDKGYNESAVDSLIQNYVDTFAFAKLDTQADGSADPVQSASQSETPSDLWRGFFPMTAQQPAKPPLGVSQPSTSQELPILVGPNKVARIPFPMTEDDFDLLIGTLNLWKKKIVQSEFPKQAVWKNKDHDQPVTIIGAMGEQDGVKFFQTSTGTGIPGNELTFG